MGLPLFAMMMAPDDKPIPSLRAYIIERQNKLGKYAVFFRDFVKSKNYDVHTLSGLNLYAQNHLQKCYELAQFGSKHYRRLQNPELNKQWKLLAKYLEALITYLGSVNKRNYNSGKISIRITKIVSQHKVILRLLHENE